MHPRPSRKKELARRTFVYALMTFSMVGLLIVLMMTVLGYQFDIKNRSVEQTGLVQYDSFPRQATVSVDGRQVGRTQTKSTVLPGVHQFSMTADGYEPWRKTLDIEAGTVTWLSYARLVPTEKVITTSESYGSIEAASTSPDRRYMAFWRMEENVPSLGLMDFRDSAEPSVSEYTLSAEQLGGIDADNAAEEHRFELSGWSLNGRYFVTKHTYTSQDSSSKVEWIWTDRESPSNSVNLTTLLGLEIDSVQPMNGRSVFVLSNNDVREASVGNGSISKPLITGVNSFSARDDDVITYHGETESDDVLGVWRRDGANGPVTIASHPKPSSAPVRILSSRYFNKDTIAVSIGEQVTFYRGEIPTSDEGLAALLQTGVSFSFDRKIDSMHMSDGGRFLIAEDSTSYMTYDLERQEVSQNVRKYAPSSLRWLDAYHVVQVDESGEMIMQEFDGLNSNKLMPASAKYDYVLTRDGKYVYAWVEQDDVVELRRLSMTTS